MDLTLLDDPFILSGIDLTLNLTPPSSYNLVLSMWYMIKDSLQVDGYKMHLVNPSTVHQYEGLAHSDDGWDSFRLAHMLRLGILPRKKAQSHWYFSLPFNTPWVEYAINQTRIYCAIN